MVRALEILDHYIFRLASGSNGVQPKSIRPYVKVLQAQSKIQRNIYLSL